MKTFGRVSLKHGAGQDCGTALVPCRVAASTFYPGLGLNLGLDGFGFEARPTTLVRNNSQNG